MGLLLEGADNSGKTTLAKDLRQLNHRLKYFHSGSAPQNADHESMCILQQYEKCSKSDTIVDRATCISQQVYGGRLFEPTLMQELDKLLRIGTLIVYCRPSTDRLMSFEHFTWRDEESEEYKQEIIHNQHKYIAAYDSLMRQVPHIAYDFEDELASGWLRKMLSEAPYDQMTYWRLHEVMMNSTRLGMPRHD